MMSNSIILIMIYVLLLFLKAVLKQTFSKQTLCISLQNIYLSGSPDKKLSLKR